MATRRYKPVPVEKFESVLAWLRVRVEFNCVFQPCTTRFFFGVIVPASYDEYTALVKSGNVASKHVNE